jgi:hypothetical protein
MTRYSYKRKYAAHILGGYGYVYLPDEIADNSEGMGWEKISGAVLGRDNAAGKAQG